MAVPSPGRAISRSSLPERSCWLTRVVDVLEVVAEELAAGAAGPEQHVAFLGDHGLPVLFRRVGAVDGHHPVIGGVAVGLDQERAADVVDHAVIELEARAKEVEGVVLLVQVAEMDLRAVGALGDAQEEEAAVLGDLGAVIAQRVRGVGEDQRVLFLGVAQLVVVDLLVLVLGLQLVARLGLVVAGVIKAVAAPRRPGELHPAQAVVQLAAVGDLQHADLPPVGAGFGAGDGHVAVVPGLAQQADAHGAVGRQGVGVDKDLRLAVQPLLVVMDRLVLQPVVLGDRNSIRRRGTGPNSAGNCRAPRGAWRSGRGRRWRPGRRRSPCSAPRPRP